jgi:hypothetical protein
MITMSSGAWVLSMIGPRIRAAIITVLCVVLAGCSALRLAYNQADEFSYWWLDGYFDFDDTQTPRVRNAIASWFAWHRRTQLPEYAELLVRARNEMLADTTPAASCAWWTLGRQRAEAAYEQAIPALAEQVISMKPEQIEAFARKQQKNNEKFRDEFMQRDPKKRLEAGVERGVERAEMIYGPLVAEQRALIERQTAASPYDAEATLAERRLRQAELLSLLRAASGNGGDRQKVQAMLREYGQRWFNSPRPAFRAYTDKLTAYLCEAAATFHNATTRAQRQHGADKLKGWEADLRALAAQP